VPCIKKHIIRFVDEHNLQEEVMSIFDIEAYRQQERASSGTVPGQGTQDAAAGDEGAQDKGGKPKA